MDNDSKTKESFPLGKMSQSSKSSSVGKNGSLTDRDFLRCVIRNDVTGVKALAAEGRLCDPQACDDLGRTAMVVAIDKENFGEQRYRR